MVVPGLRAAPLEASWVCVLKQTFAESTCGNGADSVVLSLVGLMVGVLVGNGGQTVEFPLDPGTS